MLSNQAFYSTRPCPHCYTNLILCGYLDIRPTRLSLALDHTGHDTCDLILMLTTFFFWLTTLLPWISRNPDRNARSNHRLYLTLSYLVCKRQNPSSKLMLTYATDSELIQAMAFALFSCFFMSCFQICAERHTDPSSATLAFLSLPWPPLDYFLFLKQNHLRTCWQVRRGPRQ